MPSLKDLTCHIQWADTSCPFPDYGTLYGDGLVETYIAVPGHPQVFTIHLTSRKFIAEGLAMVVFIDGRYQCNRNRVNLEPEKKGVPENRSRIDFLVRQNEKPLGEGTYMGREWRFDDYNLGELAQTWTEPKLIGDDTVSQLPQGTDESHFSHLGTIEVLVLRCQSRHTYEKAGSTSSSAEHSEIMVEQGSGMLGSFTVAENGTKKSSGTISEMAAPPTQAAEPDGLFGGLMGIFDGPADEPPTGRIPADAPYDGHYSYFQAPSRADPRYGPQEGPTYPSSYRSPPTRYEEVRRPRYPYGSPPSVAYGYSARSPPRHDRHVHFDYGDGRGFRRPDYDTRYEHQRAPSRERDDRHEYMRTRSSYQDPHWERDRYADYPTYPERRNFSNDMGGRLNADHADRRHLHDRYRPRSPPPVPPIQQPFVAPAFAAQSAHLHPQLNANGLQSHVPATYAVPHLNVPHAGGTVPSVPGLNMPVQPAQMSHTQAQAPYIMPAGFPSAFSVPTWPGTQVPLYHYPPGHPSFFPPQVPNPTNAQAITSANSAGSGHQGQAENGQTSNNGGWDQPNRSGNSGDNTNNNNTSGAAWGDNNNNTADASNNNNAPDTDWEKNPNANNFNADNSRADSNNAGGNNDGNWPNNNDQNNNSWENNDNNNNNNSWENNDNDNDNNNNGSWENNNNGSGGNNNDQSWNNSGNNNGNNGWKQNNSNQNAGGDGWGAETQNNQNGNGGNDQANGWNNTTHQGPTPNNQGNSWQNGQNNANFQPTPAGNQANARVLYGPYGPYYGAKSLAQQGPAPDAEEELRYDVPQSIAQAKGVTKQVQPGPGYLYVKKRCAPTYIDTLDEPYAKFVFKYRTKEQLKNEIGVDVGGEPTGDEEVNTLEFLDKAELMQLVLRAKGALGGAIPEPPPKITPSFKTGFEQMPVPVPAPELGFLNYNLPALRQPAPNAGLGIRYPSGGNNVQNNTTNGNTGNWDNSNNQQNNNGTNNNWTTGAVNNSGWDGQQEQRQSQPAQSMRNFSLNANFQTQDQSRRSSGISPKTMPSQEGRRNAMQMNGPSAQKPIVFEGGGTTGGGQTTWDTKIAGAGPRPDTPPAWNQGEFGKFPDEVDAGAGGGGGGSGGKDEVAPQPKSGW